MINQSRASSHINSDSRFLLQVCIGTLCRLVLVTARRLIYPFAPSLSRNLGISLESVTFIIAANQITAITGIFLGPIADRLGYRLMMLIGMFLLVVGMVTAGFWPIYVVILVGFFLAGLGRSLFDPALQAYVSERVPYNRRGLFISATEFSYAGATLIGIPLLAVVIGNWGWKPLFFIMGIAGLIGLLSVTLLIDQEKKQDRKPNIFSAFKQTYRQLFTSRTALGMLGYSFFMTFANDNLFVVYGVWLESRFNLSIVSLGMGTIAIGMAELAGSSIAAFFSDRVGLKRAVIWGTIATILCYSFLPFLDQFLLSTLCGIFMLFLIFEFTFVIGISLSTEVLPAVRATMMAGFYATTGIGRVIGAVTGMSVWMFGKLTATVLMSTILTMLALAVLLWGLKGKRF
ncbi:MAG: MFS transporter [Deltaproteobacteria bacterium]|nr:MFS transporter [Deltaproteobacteria bacterium]